MPYDYYPNIKTPLRNKCLALTHKLRINNKKLFKRRRTKSKSKNNSSKRKSSSKIRSRSRSSSAKRKLVYDEDNIENYDAPHISVYPENNDYYESDKYSSDEDVPSDLLSKTDARELAFFIRELLLNEHKLEITKSHLAIRPDFNLLDAFAMFDKQGHGWIHYFDIVDVLKSVGLKVSSDEGKLFMLRYDTDDDQRLGFYEFSRVFTPIVDTLEFQKKSRRRNSTSSWKAAEILQSKSHLSLTNDQLNGFDAFEYETKVLFLDAFKVHFEVEKAIERWRQSISRVLTLSPRNAFLYLGAKSENGYLTSHHILKLLKRFDIYPTESEMKLIMYRFTNNINEDKIGYFQFIGELTRKIINLID